MSILTSWPSLGQMKHKRVSPSVDRASVSPKRLLPNDNTRTQDAKENARRAWGSGLKMSEAEELLDWLEANGRTGKLTCVAGKSFTVAVYASLVALGLLVGGAGQVKADIVYDPAADFSATNNPNGVWSYGWSPTLGGMFNLDRDRATLESVDFWQGNRGGIRGEPVVDHNGRDMPLVLAGTVLFQPGQIGLHPGPHGEFSVVRWTAPQARIITLAATFFGMDFLYLTSTDAHVLHNGRSIFDSLVEGFGPEGQASLTIPSLAVVAGDTIDFAVGWGRDANYNGDTTGLAATIAPVPEPSTILLLIMGALGAIGWAWRRKEYAQLRRISR